VLAGLRERSGDRLLDVGVDPARFIELGIDLLVWEAVAADGRTVDVALAAREGGRRLDARQLASDVVEPVCVSLIGAAIAASGLSARVLGPPWVVAVPTRPSR